MAALDSIARNFVIPLSRSFQTRAFRASKRQSRTRGIQGTHQCSCKQNARRLIFSENHQISEIQGMYKNFGRNLFQANAMSASIGMRLQIF